MTIYVDMILKKLSKTIFTKIKTLLKLENCRECYGYLIKVYSMFISMILMMRKCFEKGVQN